jgi:hypothetical protein
MSIPFPFHVFHEEKFVLSAIFTEAQQVIRSSSTV